MGKAGGKQQASTKNGIGNKVLIVGLITAVITYLMVLAPEWAEFMAGSPNLKESKVKNNMRTCQLAAEAYAMDHAGLYPKSMSDSVSRSYFPKGHMPDRPGVPPVNPVTNLPEWPIDGAVSNVREARQQTVGQIAKGTVEYSVILNAKGQPTSYAVRGGDITGSAITFKIGKPPHKVLVLSNQ